MSSAPPDKISKEFNMSPEYKVISIILEGIPRDVYVQTCSIVKFCE